MASNLSKIFRPSKTKFWWAYIVLGILTLILGILILPVWSGTDVFWADWGAKAVLICIAILILIYLFTFLVKKVKGGGAGATRILAIIEFIIMMVIALGCVLSVCNISLGIPTDKEACVILGIAFYCRGVVEIFRSFYHKASSVYYPLWWLAVSVGFVTLGCFLFFKPLFSNETVQWIISVVFIVLAVLFICLAFVAKPQSRTTSKR